MATAPWTVERARLANAIRNNRPAQADEARRNLAAVRLEEHIRKTLAASPPFTAEQRDKLAVLLRGGAAA